MPKRHRPRHGSLQYWPHRRAKCKIARIRFWPQGFPAKPLAFISYKAGMSHLLAVDNRPKSLSKGESIFLPVTILDCPPMAVAGLTFYKNSKKNSQILAPKPDKILARALPLPKKETKRLESVKDFDDLRLLVQSQPHLTTTGAKTPRLLEIALGGKKEEKLKYAEEKLGKEIRVEEVFEAGNFTDVHGITKGKGFQGTVKRFGVPLRQHKAEKTKRGIGNLGPWTPKRISFRIPQSGRSGYHLRTEYNKQILKVSDKPSEINPAGGLKHYGLVKAQYLLLKGSVPGPTKRALVLVPSLRPRQNVLKEAPEIRYIAK